MTTDQHHSRSQAGAVTGEDGILIAGLAHSGKTEVRRLMDTSPDLFTMRRAPFWTAQPTRWGSLQVDANLSACLADLRKHPGLDSWTTDLRDTGSGYFAESHRSYSGLLAYVHGLEAHQRGTKRWCVQVGGIEQRLRDHLEQLPGLRVVHTVRDPRDRLSLTRSTRVPGRRGRDLARWERSVQVALECRARFPDRYMIVTWEELIENRERLSLKLEEFIGVHIDPTREDMPDADKIASTGAISGPHTVRAVGDLLVALGYESTTSATISFGDFIEYASFELHRRFANGGEK